ncbi:MAG: F0F1 ATP synthase subunit B [Bacteroidia bacterium]|nr:F0F1 ATP synthase subunit B [Bacteroidia bacterium]
MELVLPQFGLFFWTIVIFLIFFFILKKFAWGFILKAIQEREQSIETSLKAAEAARIEMEKLTANNEAILRQAQIERDAILREAKMAGEKIVTDAKDKAAKEAAILLERVKNQIQAEKMAALTDIKNQIGELSLKIAETILKNELADKSHHEKYIQSVVSDINLN